MTKDLTKGNETKVMLYFVLPMIIGNIFQQLYNVADSIVVGYFIGPNALAAVGSSFTLMVFLTSIILGLSMGSGTVFSQLYGSGKYKDLRNSIFTTLIFIGFATIILTLSALLFLDELLLFMQIPDEIMLDTKTYLQIIFYGIPFVSLYNYYAAILRSLGNSIVPLIFLIISAIINIILDLIFVVPLDMGVAGAAYATIIAQGFSAFGLLTYSLWKIPLVRFKKQDIYINHIMMKRIMSYSLLTSIQQSIMNFGIVLVQGLVNSYGVTAMAAFTAATKIDSFAYISVQDFGNAFSTFIGQNKGAGEYKRIQNAIRSGLTVVTLYCIIISLLVLFFAKPLLHIFIDPTETEIIKIGIQYLFIVGCFYTLIGYLFMLYGYFRGIGHPGFSIILTVISLGLRVFLAYTLSSISTIGLAGIWWAIPIGWLIADIVGFWRMLQLRKHT